MGVVLVVEDVVVEGTVEPVVDVLGWAHVDEEQDENSAGVPEGWEVGESGEHGVHERGDDDVEEDVVVPGALPVHLVEADPLALNAVLPREPVPPRQAHPRLPVHVAQHRHAQHVQAPVVRLMPPEQVRVHSSHRKRDKQSVLHKTPKSWSRISKL